MPHSSNSSSSIFPKFMQHWRLIKWPLDFLPYLRLFFPLNFFVFSGFTRYFYTEYCCMSQGSLRRRCLRNNRIRCFPSTFGRYLLFFMRFLCEIWHFLVINSLIERCKKAFFEVFLFSYNLFRHIPDSKHYFCSSQSSWR
jgi:hypothetical protein